MKNIRNRISTLVFAFLLTVSLALAYRTLPRIYFLHDEWRALGRTFVLGSFEWVRDYSLPEILFGKGRMLGSSLYDTLLTVFQFNALPFAILFFCTHLLNSMLLYVLVKRETKSIVWAGSAALLFATSARYEQALTWIAAGDQVLFSALFSLLSITLLLRQKKPLGTWILILLFAYVGFLFKEAMAYTFILIFFVLLKQKVLNAKRIAVICAVGIVILTVLTKFYSSNVAKTEGLGVVYILAKGIFNAGFYPLVSFAQYAIPYRYMERLGYALLTYNYGFMRNDGNTESIVHFILADYISVFISIVMIGICFVAFKKYIKKYPFLSFAIIWYLLTLLPVSFRLINRFDSYINSEYMYYGGMPFWILIGGVVDVCYQRIQQFKWKRIVLSLGIIIFFAILWKQIQITHREVRVTAMVGDDMRYFMRELRTIQPTLPQKPVIFMDSDRHYILENTKIPFLLGDGFILSVLLYPTGKIPSQIILKNMYEGFGEQGYTEENGKGFGYYVDKATLMSELQKGTFAGDQVVYWYYLGDAHVLENRTSEIQKELSVYAGKEQQ